jgi:YD repeat-containing protein
VETQVVEDGDELTFHYGMRPDDMTGDYNGDLVAEVGYTTVDHAASGDRTVYRYDAAGQIVATYDAFGNPVGRTWSDGKPGTSTSRGDIDTEVTYDDAGRSETVTETDGTTTRQVAAYTYVTADTAPGAAQDRRLASSENAAGVVTEFAYTDTDAPELPSEVTTPCDPVSTAVTCPTGDKVTTTTDYSGATGQHGLPLSITDPDGVVTTYTYHADRSLASVTTTCDTTAVPDCPGSGELTTTYVTADAGDTGWSETDTRVVKTQTVTSPGGAVTITKFDVFCVWVRRGGCAAK